MAAPPAAAPCAGGRISAVFPAPHSASACVYFASSLSTLTLRHESEKRRLNVARARPFYDPPRAGARAGDAPSLEFAALFVRVERVLIQKVLARLDAIELPSACGVANL